MLLKKYVILILVALAFAPTAISQDIDRKLQRLITAETKGFQGELGVYIIDMKKDRVAGINIDTLFPTASIVKIPIMLGVMDQIRQGLLEYHQKMTYTDSLFYSEGEDILASFKPGETISIAKLLMLMLSTSDNTASLWLQGLSGGGAQINLLMDSLGFPNTKVNSRVEGRKPIWEIYGWGQTTPKEISEIMQLIVEKKVFNSQLSERMLRMMGRQYWDENGIAAIPPDVFIADKTGAVDASRNEVMYVNGPHPYIFSIFSKNNTDQSWEPTNAAWQLIQRLSAAVWKYFNPRQPYTAQPYLP